MASTHAEPIAVIGMACRLPGSSNSPDQFWDLLANGRSAIGPIPDEYRRPGEPPILHAAALLDDVEHFDAAHFGFREREAHASDPRLRLLLMCAQEAVDNAGLTNDDVAGPRTGVWVGECNSDYCDLSVSAANSNMYTLSTGNTKSFLGGRVSHFFDTQGPTVTLDSACSSGLTAVHSAARALRYGDIDVGFAAATSVILNPDGWATNGMFAAISPHGRTRFGDADTEGFARGEGVGAVLLKRLSDALSDGDPVHAVVEGTAINSNGRSGKNPVASSATAQVAMMRAALADAGARPEDIGVIEAHGTGTPVGDKIELAALHQVYGQNPNPCLVGSVKTNVGHSESCAGMTGLIKSILALTNGHAPPSLGHRNPTNAIPWDASALKVPTTLERWPLAASPRRAAVSSFGLSGSNAHAIVAVPPLQDDARDRFPQREWNLRRYWYTELQGARA